MSCWTRSLALPTPCHGRANGKHLCCQRPGNLLTRSQRRTDGGSVGNVQALTTGALAESRTRVRGQERPAPSLRPGRRSRAGRSRSASSRALVCRYCQRQEDHCPARLCCRWLAEELPVLSACPPLCVGPRRLRVPSSALATLPTSGQMALMHLGSVLDVPGCPSIRFWWYPGIQEPGQLSPLSPPPPSVLPSLTAPMVDAMPPSGTQGVGRQPMPRPGAVLYQDSLGIDLYTPALGWDKQERRCHGIRCQKDRYMLTLINALRFLV